MPTRILRDYLDRHEVAYRVVPHAPAYTASEVAAAAHVTGKHVVKTVMVKLDGKLAMVALPSPSRIDLEALRETTGARELELAREDEFRDLFPGCETGAMPPFGNLYGVHVYVTDELAREPVIAFNAGTHTELVEMSYADFQRLVRPRVIAEPIAI
jgi:Ala-tRNA(Pro) deacylase